MTSDKSLDRDRATLEAIGSIYCGAHRRAGVGFDAGEGQGFSKLDIGAWIVD